MHTEGHNALTKSRNALRNSTWNSNTQGVGQLCLNRCDCLLRRIPFTLLDWLSDPTRVPSELTLPLTALAVVLSRHLATSCSTLRAPSSVRSKFSAMEMK